MSRLVGKSPVAQASITDQRDPLFRTGNAVYLSLIERLPYQEHREVRCGIFTFHKGVYQIVNVGLESGLKPSIKAGSVLPSLNSIFAWGFQIEFISSSNLCGSTGALKLTLFP